MLEVLQFASRAHKTQLRKNPVDTPYISHPLAVALILSKAGFKEEVVMAGALHDVIEDTAVTEEELRKEFGDEICNLVLGVTENKKLEWHERKLAYNENLKKQNTDILAISAADLLANRMSLILELRKGNNPWPNFSKEPKEYVEKIKKIDGERIEIIASKLNHPLVPELQEAEKLTWELTEQINW